MMEQRITEEYETLDEMYTCQRIMALPEELQRLAVLHLLDQYEAVASYFEQQASLFAAED